MTKLASKRQFSPFKHQNLFLNLTPGVYDIESFWPKFQFNDVRHQSNQSMESML